MIRNYALALLLIGFVAFSCQKEADDNGGGGGKTKMDLITSAAWKYDTAAIDVDGNGSTEQAIPPGYILSCDKDNTITLKKDGSGTVDEGGTKCNTTDPQQTNITWQFKENETVINIPDQIFGGISGDAKILELTETRLKITKKVDLTDPIPISVWVVVTLKH